MSEEDIFNSQPITGSISYRIPSVAKFFNLPEDHFDHYSYMTFWISVVVKTNDDSVKEMVCKSKNNCKLRYRRPYTPTMYYLQPRVTYYESWTEVYFNPAATQALIEDLDSDELPFINAKIGGNLIDFEFGEDSLTSFNAWSLNSARGQIGENSISKD
jgi:hypothetical protein